MKKCSICGKEKNLLTHHLSYDPEVITKMCQACHLTIHYLARLSKEQQNIIDDWVKQYGHLWENGREKCKKTEHWKNNNKRLHKEYMKEYSKTDKFKNYQKEVILKKDPERFLQIIEDMERKLRIVEGTA